MGERVKIFPTRSGEPVPARDVLISEAAQFLIECALLLAILFALVLCYLKLDETNKDQKLLQIYFHQLSEKIVTKGDRP